MPYIAPVVTMCICSKNQQICPSFILSFKILNQLSFILNISQQQKFSIFLCKKITVVSILCILYTTTVREKMQQAILSEFRLVSETLLGNEQWFHNIILSFCNQVRGQSYMVIAVKQIRSRVPPHQYKVISLNTFNNIF